MSSILSRIINSVEVLILRALAQTVDDTNALQLMKISSRKDETQETVERIQNYGFTSVPPANSEAVVVNMGGDKDNAVVVSCDCAEHRPNGLSGGECAMYSQHGQQLLLDAAGNIKVAVPTVVDIGTPISAVALALPIDTFLNALVTAVAPGGTPILTPPPLTPCPVAAAMYAALIAAYPPAGPANSGATKLRSE